MAFLSAVQLPAEPPVSFWLAGLSAVAAAAILHAHREALRRRGAEAVLARCREEISGLTARLGELRAHQPVLENRYLGLAGAHGDIILLRDADGCLTHMNEAFAATFGVVRKSLLGTRYHPPADSIASGTPHAFRSADRLSRVRYEQRLHTVDGWRWFAWEDQAIHAADGSVLEIQSTGRDVTEIRNARARELAAKSLAETHSRRRKILKQALVRDLLPVASRLTRVAGRTAPAMRALPPRLAALRDILTFEGERVNVTCQPFEVRPLVAAAVNALADGVPGSGCGIASVISTTVPRRVSGDAVLLRQVIERLAEPVLGDGNGICIRVSAQGERLLLEFETPWPRPGRQSGRFSDLALAAVSPAVEAMSGELTIRHSDGAASVRVELPAPAAGETVDVDAARGTALYRPSPGTLAGSF